MKCSNALPRKYFFVFSDLYKTHKNSKRTKNSYRSLLYRTTNLPAEVDQKAQPGNCENCLIGIMIHLYCCNNIWKLVSVQNEHKERHM